MAELIFHGPFHFDDIDKTGKIKINDKNVPNPNQAGIYIWGFMYYYGRHGLIAPVYHRNSLPEFNPGVMKFIPYYVGEHQKNMFCDRISKHHDIRKSPASKYTRLSHGYMTAFFKDDNFPIPTSVKSDELVNLFRTSSSTIIYHNNGNVLKEIYPDIQPQPSLLKNENPITNFQVNKVDIPDSLEDIVDCMNNFWFCFAVLDKSVERIKTYETTVYYSLKGRTISNTQLFVKEKHCIEIINCTSTRIFKENKEKGGVVQPSD